MTSTDPSAAVSDPVDPSGAVEPETDAAPSRTPDPTAAADVVVPRNQEIVDAEIVVDPTPSGVPAPAFDYTDDGVPTLDYVRSKVEGRLATAEGYQELHEDRTRSAEAAAAERDRLAQEKLAALRRSLGTGRD